MYIMCALIYCNIQAGWGSEHGGSLPAGYLSTWPCVAWCYPTFSMPHCSAHLFFLHTCSDLFLDEQVSLLPLGRNPITNMPTSSFNLRRDSATSPALSTLHFLHVLTWTPADKTFWSWESVCCRASHVHTITNPSVRPLKRSCKVLVMGLHCWY